uniref:Uncharacterized protein n=1 Tax=Cacopsylla melanoneura TaxID=428564 RepID=A0A8D8W3R6_9HEMI
MMKNVPLMISLISKRKASVLRKLKLRKVLKMSTWRKPLQAQLLLRNLQRFNLKRKCLMTLIISKRTNESKKKLIGKTQPLILVMNILKLKRRLTQRRKVQKIFT